MILEIIGIPAPQGSKSAYVNKSTGRAVVVEGKGPSRLAVHEWRSAVADACRRHLAVHPQPPLQGPLSVEIRFRFPAVKSAPYRYWHATKPDLDKLVRSTFDALTLGGAIADDSAISKLTTVKRYINGSETAGASVEIISLASEEDEVAQSRRQRARALRRESNTVTLT